MKDSNNYGIARFSSLIKFAGVNVALQDGGCCYWMISQQIAALKQGTLASIKGTLSKRGMIADAYRLNSCIYRKPKGNRGIEMFSVSGLLNALPAGMDKRECGRNFLEAYNHLCTGIGLGFALPDWYGETISSINGRVSQAWRECHSLFEELVSRRKEDRTENYINSFRGKGCLSAIMVYMLWLIRGAIHLAWILTAKIFFNARGPYIPWGERHLFDEIFEGADSESATYGHWRDETSVLITNVYESLFSRLEDVCETMEFGAWGSAKMQAWNTASIDAKLANSSLDPQLAAERIGSCPWDADFAVRCAGEYGETAKELKSVIRSIGTDWQGACWRYLMDVKMTLFRIQQKSERLKYVRHIFSSVTKGLATEGSATSNWLRSLCMFAILKERVGVGRALLRSRYPLAIAGLWFARLKHTL